MVDDVPVGPPLVGLIFFLTAPEVGVVLVELPDVEEELLQVLVDLSVDGTEVVVRFGAYLRESMVKLLVINK